MNSVLFAALLFAATAARASGDPTLKANPNPVIVPAGQTQSTTTLTWNTEGAGGYVWLSVDGGEETQLTRAGAAAGTLGATGEIGKSYVFKLYTADKQQLLASVTVTVSAQQATPPPAATRPGRVRASARAPRGGAVVSIEPSAVVPVENAGKTSATSDRAYGSLKDPNAARVVEVEKESRGGAAILANLRFLSNVQARVDKRNVIISFSSTQNSPPLIEIGKVAPVPDQNGLLAFPAESGASSHFVSGRNGNYSFNLNALNERLDFSTTYYYVINVFNDDKSNTRRPRDQVTGKFSTVVQTVKVVFTGVHLFTELLDPTSIYKAKYVFFFDVNVNYPNLAGFCWCRQDWIYHVPGRRLLGEVRELRDNNTGTYYEPGPVEWPKGNISLQGQEVDLGSSPDDLRIVVQGIQDATHPTESKQQPYTTFSAVILRTATSGPGNAPNGNGGIAWYNVAEGTFDLSAYNLGPGDRVTLPFSLTSATLDPKRGRLGGFLAFEITGRIEVTRH